MGWKSTSLDLLEVQELIKVSWLRGGSTIEIAGFPVLVVFGFQVALPESNN